MCPTNLAQRNQTLWNPQNWSLLQEVKMQIIFCFKWARWMHNFPQRNTFVSGSFCQESKFWGLQLLAVSDCPFQTAGSSAFLRRIWSKDRKRTELCSSIVFQNILCERCLCFPGDHTCPRNFQTLAPKGESIVTPNLLFSRRGFPLPFLQHLLWALILSASSLLLSSGKTPIKMK